MGKGKLIVRGTMVIFVFTLLSRVLGLGREAAIAYRFGATGMTDAFMLAFTIPNFFYKVVGMTLATVIVPIFADYSAQGRRDEGWRVLSLVINAVLAVMGVMVLVGVVGAPYITDVLGGGFTPEIRQLATGLTAAIMPSVLFMSLAGVLGGILNGNDIFWAPALGPALMNIVMITSALVVCLRFGIYGLAVGTVVGACLYAMVQIPALRRTGFVYSLALSYRDPAVRRVVSAMWPVLLTSGIIHVYAMIDLRFGSGLTAGSITALNYARKLINLPQALFVTAVTTAIFPTLSRLVVEGKKAEMSLILQKGVRAILLPAIPGAMGLLVLRVPVVTLLFQRGAFDSKATIMTADALRYFTLALVGLCLHLPLTRGFFALGDLKTPFWAALLSIGMKAVLSSLFIGPLQHSGLALATSLTIFLNAIALAGILQYRVPGLFDRAFMQFVGVTLFLTGVMGSVVFGVDGLLALYCGDAWWGLALRVGLDIAVGALVFVIGGVILRLDEVQLLGREIRKLRKTKFNSTNV